MAELFKLEPEPPNGLGIAAYVNLEHIIAVIMKPVGAEVHTTLHPQGVFLTTRQCGERLVALMGGKVE